MKGIFLRKIECDNDHYVVNVRTSCKFKALQKGMSCKKNTMYQKMQNGRPPQEKYFIQHFDDMTSMYNVIQAYIFLNSHEPLLNFDKCSCKLKSI